MDEKRFLCHTSEEAIQCSRTRPPCSLHNGTVVFSFSLFLCLHSLACSRLPCSGVQTRTRDLWVRRHVHCWGSMPNEHDGSIFFSRESRGEGKACIGRGKRVDVTIVLAGVFFQECVCCARVMSGLIRIIYILYQSGRGRRGRERDFDGSILRNGT